MAARRELVDEPGLQLGRVRWTRVQPRVPATLISDVNRKSGKLAFASDRKWPLSAFSLLCAASGGLPA